MRKKIGWGCFALMVSLIGFLFVKLNASLPVADGKLALDAIEAPVTITQDRFAIPTINASSRNDAFFALGYLSARDRLFQMDLLRRRSAGRLAELFGEQAVKFDVQQRFLGLARAAERITKQLPTKQKDVMQTYADGVNAFLTQTDSLPVELMALGMRPEPWRIQDSVLVALGMFQILSGGDNDERMLTVMERTLSPEVVAFLTPDTDSYDTVLLGGPESHRPAREIPVEALVALLGTESPAHLSQSVQVPDAIIGSNNWAVSRLKTHDGRAILANDMHLKLGVPNIWYRAVIQYQNIRLSGLTLPGIPGIVAGSNDHVAWGFTNVAADLRDLVRLEVNPQDSTQYRTSQGWQSFESIEENIQVKDGESITIKVKQTIWGPVASAPLLDQAVALRWTALDPEAVNFRILDMDQAFSLERAMQVLNDAGIPPNNVLLTDDRGRIAWTYAGMFPLRKGFDGSVSRSWADGQIGWRGYIKASALPRIIDPPSGFLATANNRTLGKGYPYPIGHNFGHSYRAYRISERLQAMTDIRERDMLDLQTDTTSHFFSFYQQLALEMLTEPVITAKPYLLEVKQLIKNWNGRADVNSRAFGILVELRKSLSEMVIAPFLTPCKQEDSRFVYSWSKMDTPLRKLLSERIPETLPKPDRYSDWNALIISGLEKSTRRLLEQYEIESLQDLRWGEINRSNISHPISRSLPLLGYVLDMPRATSGGCGHCVRVSTPNFGASERFVIAPNHSSDAILHMPAGQSGHPFSSHYADQHPYWQSGLPLPFNPGKTEHTLTFVPTEISE